MFIISLTYKKDISEIEKFIESHIAFLDKHYAKKLFIASGRKHPRTGGVIITRQMDRSVLEEIIKQDPFYVHELADYDIMEFIPTKFDDDFRSFTL